MQLGLIGLGKMGANMARRLSRGGHRVVAYDRTPEPANVLAEQESCVSPAHSLEELAAQLAPPRVAWMMVPAGKPTESVLAGLMNILTQDDIVIDGGNANYRLQVRLVGIKAGSGKNNHYGIGSKVEVRAGDHYQMKLVTEPVVHFGLGKRSRADVVRILWTNGTPQNIFSPGVSQDLIEEQQLKGSCPFLYTWARFDPEGAFERTRGWTTRVRQRVGTAAVVYAWALRDPLAAAILGVGGAHQNHRQRLLGVGWKIHVGGQPDPVGHGDHVGRLLDVGGSGDRGRRQQGRDRGHHRPNQAGRSESACLRTA